ncbi:RHS repeat-associated core domain-containing protein [Moritella sp. 28]|uniref:RHS repeat-associated core domain-containing protein n=1 Tax=Moritella sp. 28 TaxID=2746232 RepID=UPI001BA75FDD|nr:RHS repeat-associated core domain-containing protein [Moritella sp. 28]QUM86395.1 RHS repeat-associated core domain-containing protein [Moritella sp. 28]
MQASYNALNQIVSYNGATDAFRYDADGNLIKGLLAGNISFTAMYDAENRLIQLDFSKNGKVIREAFAYTYDSTLARYQRYLAATKAFVRFGLVELEQRDADNSTIAEFAWNLYQPGGVGGLLSMKTANKRYYYQTNHLGHVLAVTKQDGSQIAEYEYNPYGEVFGSDFSQQPFGYSTKRSDFTSGLVYFGYRFYMPNMGRWLNRDPLQEQGGINLYAYVNGDPMGYVDPDGRNPLVLGALVNMAYEGYKQYQSGNLDMRRLGVAGVTGALGGLGSTAFKAAAFGALAGVTNAGYQEFTGNSGGHCDGSNEVERMFRAAVYGAGGAIIGAGMGAFGKNFYKAPNTKVFNPAIKETVNYGSHGSAIGAVAGGIYGNQ